MGPETWGWMVTTSRAVARPISDKRGPAAFRLRILGVLARRVVAEAVRRYAERSATAGPSGA